MSAFLTKECFSQRGGAFQRRCFSGEGMLFLTGVFLTGTFLRKERGTFERGGVKQGQPLWFKGHLVAMAQTCFFQYLVQLKHGRECCMSNIARHSS